MRRTIRTLGIATAGFVAAISAASAGDPYQQSRESRVYLGFSFGGDKVAPRDLHYGLRFDHDSRFVDSGFVRDSNFTWNAPALVQFDFARAHLNDARVNGLSVLSHEYRLHQTEGASGQPPPVEQGAPTEAPAEAPAQEGFFTHTWHSITGFFGGLFGSSEEKKPAETAKTEPPPPAPAAEEASAGGMGIIDWGLLAVGVAGVAAAGTQAIGKKTTPDAGQPGGVGGGTGGTGGTSGGTVGGTVPCVPGVTCLTPGRAYNPYDVRSSDPEYQRWLDGGTGHMGDLGG